jgi:hypothetical protein
MKLKVYKLWLDDGEQGIRVIVPARNKKEAEKYVFGNGRIVAIEESELQSICLDSLSKTLKEAGWGSQEIDIITRTLDLVGFRRN